MVQIENQEFCGHKKIKAQYLDLKMRQGFAKSQSKDKYIIMHFLMDDKRFLYGAEITD